MRHVPTLFCVLLLCGCSGPWDDLADRYPEKDKKPLAKQKQTIILVGTNHQGAYSYRGLASFDLDKAGLRMSLDQPAGLFNAPIHVPTESISACSRISWIPEFDTPLWIADAKVEVVLKGYERETLDWCKAMSKPVVSREIESEWLRSTK